MYVGPVVGEGGRPIKDRASSGLGAFRRICSGCENVGQLDAKGAANSKQSVEIGGSQSALDIADTLLREAGARTKSGQRKSLPLALLLQQGSNSFADGLNF